jgi:hypothetical protein
MDVCVAELALNPVGVDGGCVSEQGLVDRDRVALAEMLPAAS